MNKLLIVFGIGAMLLASACSGGDDTTDTGGQTSCQPGTYTECKCPGGVFGEQTCGPEGKWGSCRNCQDGTDAGGGDAAVNDTGTADTGGQDTGPADGGPGDTGSTDGGPEDTGPTDTGTADAGPTDTGTADTGPTDTGTTDTGTADTGTTDTGTVDAGFDAGKPTYSISGMANLNGKPPDTLNARMKVHISTTPLAGGASDVAAQKPEGTAGFVILGIEAGTYYIYGTYETTGATPVTYYGEYAKNPVTITSDNIIGNDFSVNTITVRVTSALVEAGSKMLAGQTVSGPLLLALTATVLDPSTDTELADATVKVGDGTNTLTLKYSSKQSKYTYDWNGTAGPYVAVDGTYTFTVTHGIFWNPIVIPIAHHPLTQRPTITTPTANQHFGAVQDVTLDWTEVPESSAQEVLIFDPAVIGLPGWTKDLTGVSPNKPYAIPSAVFTPGKGYEIDLLTGKSVDYQGSNGRSTVLSGDHVLISF